MLKAEAAIRKAVDNTVAWLFAHGYRHVPIEVNNECNNIYQQPLLMPDRVHELIAQVKSYVQDGYRYLIGTSYGGNHVPRANVVKESDFLLIHGSSAEDPARIAERVRQVRVVDGYRPMPLVFNEDDHFDFDQPMDNFIAMISEYASWGHFDYRFESDEYAEGYQLVPVDCGIIDPRKKGFLELARRIMPGD